MPRRRDGGSSRIYKGGYADLGRLTGLSKRGIQNIVAELQAKHVNRASTSNPAIIEPKLAPISFGMSRAVQLWFSKGWRRALGKSKTLIS